MSVSSSDHLEQLFLAVARRGEVDALLTVGDVAETLRVEPGWVYEHAGALGALRLGAGDRAPIRFEPRTLAARVRELNASLAAQPPERKPARASRPRRRERKDGLLPVRSRVSNGRAA